jgi:hypothetical protein
MLDLSAADVFTRDMMSLSFPALFDLYMALKQRDEHPSNGDAAILGRRINGVADAIQDAEKEFLRIFNEDKTLKPDVTCRMALEARNVAEDHADWFEGKMEKCKDYPHMKMEEYITVLSKFIQCRGKRPASEISAATGGA